MCMLWLTAAAASARTMASAADVRGYYSIMEKLPTNLLLKKGKELSDANQPDSAIVCYTIVTRREKSSMTGKELTPFLRAWGGLWYVYFGAYSNYAKSKECLQHMEELSEKLGAGRANVSMTYGVMYETIAQQTNDDSLYADACKYYQKAISQAMHEKEYDAVLTSFSNMATIITEAKIDKSVLDREYPNVLKAGEDKRLKFEFEFAKLLYKCIEVAMEGKYEQAVAVCNDMLKLTGTKAQLKRYWLYIYNERSELYAKLGRYDLAISDAKKLEEQGLKDDMKDILLLAYEALAEYYGKTGDKEKSDEYHSKHLHLKDSLLNYRQLASIREMSFMSEMREIEEQIAAAERNQKIWISIAIVFSFITIIVVVFLMMLHQKNKRLRQSNEALYERNLEMLKRDEENKRLRQEEEEERQRLAAATGKYKGSNLDDAAKEQMLSKLRIVMENSDEVFMAEFSVDRLAELAESKSKIVSQVINEKCNTNFNAFVNEYRIKEACKRMNDVEATANITIEAIGNGVGFKSRNTFITAFKRFTGLTPSEYQAIAKEKHIAEKQKQN